MNPNLKNLQKIEFVLTHACTGACKHCSQGMHSKNAPRLDPALAAEVVKRVSELYEIRTVMVFGGEPLLDADGAAEIIAAARDAKIPQRQIITNGFFTADRSKMCRTAKILAESGVNDLLLSVDAFHQETIPLETVRTFALFAKAAGIPIRLQPAWLKSPEDQNPYNEATRSILTCLQRDGFAVGDGNVIFPEGNAKRYLSEYFTDFIPNNPYLEDKRNLQTLSVDADGSVLNGNLYEKSILEIMEEYQA